MIMTNTKTKLVLTLILVAVLLACAITPTNLGVNAFAKETTYVAQTNAKYAAHTGDTLTIEYKGLYYLGNGYLFKQQYGKMLYSTEKITRTSSQIQSELKTNAGTFAYDSTPEDAEAVYSTNSVSWTGTLSEEGTYYIYLLFDDYIYNPSSPYGVAYSETFYFCECFATIIVSDKDIIVVSTQSENVAVTTAEETTLSCIGSTTSTSELQYQWYRNGIETLFTTPTITIAEDKAGSYTYSCKIYAEGCEQVMSADIVVAATQVIVTPTPTPTPDIVTPTKDTSVSAWDIVAVVIASIVTILIIVGLFQKKYKRRK